MTHRISGGSSSPSISSGSSSSAQWNPQTPASASRQTPALARADRAAPAGAHELQARAPARAAASSDLAPRVALGRLDQVCARPHNAAEAAAKPQPARGKGRRRTFDAKALTETLQAVLAAKGRAGGGAGADPLADMARSMNHSREFIASWVSEEGVIQKRAFEIGALNGYEAHRSELQAALRGLGQQGAADALPEQAVRRKEINKAVLAPRGPGPRKRFTAEDVHAILSDFAGRKAPLEIAAERGFSVQRVREWVGKSRWEKANLATSVAGMPGYERLRTPLQELAQKLDLHQGDLPPPAEVKQHVDADLLVRALQAMCDRIKRPELIQHANTLKDVAQKIGTKECTLTRWLKANGAPRSGVSGLTRLDGYAERLPELRELLVRLGHAEHAEALPEGPQAPAENVVSARLLVRALRAAKSWEQNSDSPLSVRGLARELDASDTLLFKLITVQDGKVRLADPKAVATYPDYRDEREPLRKALAGVGLAREAAALPVPPVRTAEVLQTLRGRLPEAGKALADLRRDATLAPEEAARRRGVLPDVFALVAAPGGRVRPRAEIEPHLTHLEPHLSKGLDELLATLGTLAQGGTVPRPSERSTMKRVEFAPAFNEPVKLFVVPAGDPAKGKGRQLDNLYAANPELVRDPRSYEGERSRQVLRWLSTALREALPGTLEVQCQFDPDSGSIAIATGRNADARRIRDLLDSGGLADAARQALDTGQLAPRQARHARKLLQGLAEDTPGAAVDPAARQVLDAIRAKSFVVPIEAFALDGKELRLHAERRLDHWSKEARGRPLDPSQLAGTMRPCGTCADEIGLDDQARRGPFWLGRTAQAFSDTEGVIDRNVRQGIPTYVTRSREGRLTVDHDTDSDSDAPGTPSRAAPRAEPPRTDSRVALRMPAKRGAPAPQQPVKRRALEVPTRKDDASVAAPLRPRASSVAPADVPLSPGDAQIVALHQAAETGVALLRRLGAAPAFDVPVGQEQVQQVLHGLLEAGRRRFRGVVRQLERETDFRPSPAVANDVREIAAQAGVLRRSLAQAGWLQEEGRPAHGLPAAAVPPGEVWTASQAQRLFKRGEASGRGNACWFDSLAQLKLQRPRGADGGQPLVDHLAQRVRQAADRLGLSRDGEMFEDDNGAMHVIARALELQVHTFRQQGEGLGLSALQSVGSPDDPAVYLHCDDTHFVPMWPRTDEPGADALA
jgi:hypothetical protein